MKEFSAPPELVEQVSIFCFELMDAVYRCRTLFYLTFLGWLIAYSKLREFFYFNTRGLALILSGVSIGLALMSALSRMTWAAKVFATAAHNRSIAPSETEWDDTII